jgi:DNA-binding FrmR family transcriptional regulator
LQRPHRPKAADPYYGHVASAIMHLAAAEKMLLDKTPKPEITSLIAAARGAIKAIAPHLPDYINRPR